MRTFLYKFLKKIAIYTIVLLIISVCLELLIRKNTIKKQYLLQADWHCLENKNADILFIGNSRVWVQFDVKSISNSLHKSAYSLSQDGRAIDILWAKFKLYSKSNKSPEAIFLQFDPYFIASDLNDSTFFGKENYLSYLYFDNLSINHAFKNDKGYHWYDEYIPLVRYAGYGDLLISHITGNVNNKDTTAFRYGAQTQNRLWGKNPGKNLAWNSPLKTDVELNKIAYVDSFVNYCKQNKINLHLIYPPQSLPSYKVVSLKNIIKMNEYAANNNIDFYNFNTLNYNDSTLFYNHLHLNTKGAAVLTKDFLAKYYPDSL